MEPGLRSQFTRYNGHVYRMCVYRVYSPTQSEAFAAGGDPDRPEMWAGFVEDAVYRGGTGHQASRRDALIGCAQIVARVEHEKGHRRCLPPTR